MNISVNILSTNYMDETDFIWRISLCLFVLKVYTPSCGVLDQS